jgi:hypothetical protein
MWEMSRDGQLTSKGNGKYTTVTGNPSNLSNLGNPSNPSNPDDTDPPVTDPPTGSSNSSNPSNSQKGDTNAENSGTVTRITKVTTPGSSNRNLRIVKEPAQAGPAGGDAQSSASGGRRLRRRLTLEEAAEVDRLVGKGFAVDAARATVLGEDL